jgi:hypothetical protein
MILSNSNSPKFSSNHRELTHNEIQQLSRIVIKEQLPQHLLLHQRTRLPPQPYPVAIFRLTEIGEKIFHVAFSVHMQYLQERFGQLEEAEIESLQHLLKHLRQSFADDLGLGNWPAAWYDWEINFSKLNFPVIKIRSILNVSSKNC